MGDRDTTVAVAAPPVEFYDVAKTEVRDQIKNMLWHDRGRPGTSVLLGMLHDGSKRGPMEVIEMRMRDQHQIDGWKVSDAQARLSKTLQHEEPARKVGVDNRVFAADLQEEAGMADKCDAHLTVRDEHRLVGLAGARRDGGMANQFPELLGPFTQRRALKRVFQHGMPEFLLPHLPRIPGFGLFRSRSPKS